MKELLRKVILNFFCLFLISELTKSISYAGSFFVLLSAAVCLTLFNLIIKPLLNMLLLPINLLTLGAFRWIINVVVLFLVTVFVTGFKINSFIFPGISIAGFVVPKISFTFFWSLILVSFLIEVFYSAVNWVFNK